MTKLDEVRSASDALLARQEPDGSWAPAPEPAEPRFIVAGPPPELAWLRREPQETRVPLAILAGKRRPWTPFRGRSEAACVNWLLDHLDEVDAGLGLRALRALRFPEDHASVGRLRARETAQQRLLATAEAIIALQDAGASPPVHFLLTQRTSSVTVTSRVLLALNRARHADLEAQQQVIRQQMEWLLGQQRPDGSWRNPDGSPATAAVLETLRSYGYTNKSPRVQRALKTLHKDDVPPAPTALRTLALRLQGEGELAPPETIYR